MKYQNIIPIIVTLALALPALAQEPASDAVYHQQTREYTLNHDGSWTYHYSHSLKINTYLAFHNLYGEDFIVYNPNAQKLKINKSVTTTPAGKVVPSPDNAFNELLPGSCAGAPAYNDLREMVVTHTALERGAVIDFDYTLATQPSYWPWMAANDVLCTNSPIEKLTYIVHVPAGITLNYSQYNIAQQPTVVKSAGKTTYTWVLTDIPAAMREDFRSREQLGRPRIVFSTAKSLSETISGFTSQLAFTLSTSDELKTVAAKVRDEKKEDLAVALRLQDIVANEINYYPVPLANTGKDVRLAMETWQENGGTEIEKAVLLATLLKNAGITAEPVAIFPESYYDEKSGNLFCIEKYLVSAAIGKNENIMLSPLQTDSYDAGLALPGKKMVTLLNGNKFRSEKIGSPLPAISLTGNLSLDDSMKLTGNVDLQLTGKLNPYFTLSADSSRVKKLLNGAFGEKTVAKYTAGELTAKKTGVQYSIENKDGLKEVSGLYFLRIPVLASGVDSWHMTELVSQRVEPLEIPFRIRESYQYAIALPANVKVLTKDADVNLKNDMGSIRIMIKQNGRNLEITREIALNQTIVNPGRYGSFRDFINTWNNRKYAEIVLEKNN